MSAYRRSTNGEFNVRLAKRIDERKLSNIERAQANVDAWLADLEEKRANGEPTDFERACNRNLAEYDKTHGNVWWIGTILRNRAYRLWIESTHWLKTDAREWLRQPAKAGIRLVRHLAKRT